MLQLGALGFAAPWLLLGLIVLPILWWLLRATPPAHAVVALAASTCHRWPRNHCICAAADESAWNDGWRWPGSARLR